MIKQIMVLFLIIGLAAQTFSAGFLLLNYYANTAAFAKNCINKAKPKMHCNGKCQMMKKLKEEEKKDAQYPERKAQNKADVLSSKSFFNSSATNFFVPIFKITPPKNKYILPNISFPFFHPPQA